MSLKENLDRIIYEIGEAQVKSGREGEQIEIVAATKRQSPQTLSELAKDGRIKVFGENRVQEMLEKYLPEYTFDLIGQLQTNKVKYVVNKVRLIQSVDRESLAQEIEKIAMKRNKIQKILVEVNTGEEVQKGGVFPKDAISFLERLQAFPHLKTVGLMAVAPLGLAERETEKLFMEMRTLYENAKTRFKGICTLSMGMSNDYALAVRCGATMIRPGRALFGERI